jgi:antitoxin (DNA-binding transcriptional repressor) of toxin-antitoxin stability system
MKSITVGQLRRNPTSALTEVESGDTYTVTRHHQDIARLVPPSELPGLTPPMDDGPAHIATLPRVELRTAGSIDELIDAEKGEY